MYSSAVHADNSVAFQNRPSLADSTRQKLNLLLRQFARDSITIRGFINNSLSNFHSIWEDLGKWWVNSSFLNHCQVQSTRAVVSLAHDNKKWRESFAQPKQSYVGFVGCFQKTGVFDKVPWSWRSKPTIQSQIYTKNNGFRGGC